MNRLRILLSVLVVIAGLGLSIAGSYALALHALDQSEHSLCPAFDLLTRHPVPAPTDPAGNPSREQGYQLYQDFVQAKRGYHCP